MLDKRGDDEVDHDLRHQELEHDEEARAWLDGKGIAYAFHDYKTAGIDRKRLEASAKDVGWEALLNRAGTTFRKLPDAAREGVTEKTALALMEAQPSMMTPGAGDRRHAARGSSPRPTPRRLASVTGSCSLGMTFAAASA